MKAREDSSSINSLTGMWIIASNFLTIIVDKIWNFLTPGSDEQGRTKTNIDKILSDSFLRAQVPLFATSHSRNWHDVGLNFRDTRVSARPRLDVPIKHQLYPSDEIGKSLILRTTCYTGGHCFCFGCYYAILLIINFHIWRYPENFKWQQLCTPARLSTRPTPACVHHCNFISWEMLCKVVRMVLPMPISWKRPFTLRFQSFLTDEMMRVLQKATLMSPATPGKSKISGARRHPAFNPHLGRQAGTALIRTLWRSPWYLVPEAGWFKDQHSSKFQVNMGTTLFLDDLKPRALFRLQEHIRCGEYYLWFASWLPQTWRDMVLNLTWNWKERSVITHGVSLDLPFVHGMHGWYWYWCACSGAFVVLFLCAFQNKLLNVTDYRFFSFTITLWHSTWR